MPAGRPTKYKKAYCNKLVEHMKQGYSYETFGVTIGVSKQTVYDWEKHEEFLDSKKRAFAECQLFWEKMGIHGAAGRLKRFNSTAYIYNMKNRFRKSDTWKPVVEEEERQTFNFNLSYDPKRLKDE